MTAINNVSSATSATTTSSTTTSSDNLSINDFLTILSAEMQNQDPANPMDDTQFVTQLAQFSSLQQMQSMNTSINSLLVTQSSALIGKNIEAVVDGVTTEGTVDSISVKDSVPYAHVGENSIPVSSITKIN